jgi:Mg/Co/Ni transporter MgtE
MDEERAADILEEMSPDDAVDVLDEMNEDKAQELFDLMEPEEKADVAELMHFEHDTAGGLMTTEFVVFPRDLTVGEGDRSASRNGAETPNMIYYLYVVENEGSWKICGLISLRSADPCGPDIQTRRCDAHRVSICTSFRVRRNRGFKQFRSTICSHSRL